MNDTKTIPEIYKTTIELGDKSLEYLPLSTNITLQENMVEELSKLIPWIKGAKAKLAESGDGEKANNFLYLQSTIYALISLINCIINTKKNDFQQAWMDVIDAEEYIALGTRLATEPDFILYLSKHREMIEKTFFPKIPIYSSLGSIVRGGKCNLCLSNYENCEHIEGTIYRGTLCRIIDQTNLTVNHTALVRNPRDRRCIPLEMENSNGKVEDIFTKIEREITEEEIKSKGQNGFLINFIAFNNQRIDTD